MTSPLESQGPASRRSGLTLAALSVLAASAWLISRAFIGLDFTDEMQYYGEIASLTRTGKLFQDDLFIQQLGYLFLWPFFKLHAVVFPNQDYLLFFGRLLLLSGYALAGAAFWRAASRLGFSPVAKLAGLATLVAWVPFQIFAPSYNSLAYLLIVGLVARWLSRDQLKPSRYLLGMAGLLTMLTYTYPPAGVILIALATVEAIRRQGFLRGLQLAGLTLIGGLAVFGFILWRQPDFIAELLTAMEFSRAFSVGAAISQPAHLLGWAGFVLACVVFIIRQLRPATFAFLGFPQRPALRGVILLMLIAGGVAYVALNPVITYVHFTSGIMLLLLVAVSLPSTEAKGAEIRPAWIHSLELLLLVGGGLAVLVLGGWSATGYFAVALQMILLLLLAAAPSEKNPAPLVSLAAMAVALGTVFAFSSGNGLHNFGIGVAPLTPFFTLFGIRALAQMQLPPIARQIAPAGLTALIILNGFSFPYRERHGWTDFRPVRDVPAFKGIWTSPLKHQAMQAYAQLAGGFGTLKGKRVLVAGPHAWMYFASGGEPLTPMLFMHFTGGPKVDEFVGQRIFYHGEPDVVIWTNTVPAPLHAQITKWIEKGCSAQKIVMPPGFNAKYATLIPYEFGTEILLLQRTAPTP